MSEVLTVLKAVELSADYLARKGISEPRPNAELLLAHILNCKRLDLYVQFDRPLNEAEKNKYRDYLARRAKGEPLQYIVGEVEFYGLKLKVTPDVLIPRPETELLVEKVIKENEKKNPLKILDIGTGSGNIALSLKANLKQAEVIGIDISASAIEIAKANAEVNNLFDEVTFETLDIFDENITDKLQDVDIIVSNPPYVSAKEFEKLQVEIKEFEPKNAVTDGGDGLSFYRRISTVGKGILNGGGKIYFEIAEGEADDVVSILRTNDFENIKIEKDFNNIPRIVKGEIR